MITKQSLLNELYDLYRDFRTGSLYIDGARSIVFGEGSAESPIVFIGEAPGREEDIQVRPFVGRSGKLLTQAIINAGFLREQVFITNIVKCRPPENRTPTSAEVDSGKKLLLRHELAIIKPKVIVPLGLSALNGLLDEPMTMSQARGKHIPFCGAIIIPIYHPAYILRNASAKEMFFSDIKKALQLAFEAI